MRIRFELDDEQALSLQAFLMTVDRIQLDALNKRGFDIDPQKAIEAIVALSFALRTVPEVVEDVVEDEAQRQREIFFAGREAKIARLEADTKAGITPPLIGSPQQIVWALEIMGRVRAKQRWNSDFKKLAAKSAQFWIDKYQNFR